MHGPRRRKKNDWSATGCCLVSLEKICIDGGNEWRSLNPDLILKSQSPPSLMISHGHGRGTRRTTTLRRVEENEDIRM